MPSASRIRVSLHLGLLALTVGCRADSAVEGTEAPSATRSDSAGIEIVHHPLQVDRMRELAVSDSALLDETGAPYIFNSVPVWSARVDQRGMTFVADPQAATILSFSGDGKFVARIGRRGNGPGELRTPLSVVTSGDTLSVYDPMRLATLRWTEQGRRFLSEIPVAASDQGALALRVDASGVVALRRTVVGDSTRVEVGMHDAPPLVGFTEPTPPVLSLPCIPIPQRRWRLLAPQVHVHSAERRIVANGGDYVVYIIRDGGIERIIRREVPVRDANRRAIALAAGRGIRARMGATECSLSPAELADAVGVATTVPAVHGVALMSDGSLWVKRTLPGETPGLLDYFAPSGEYVMTVKASHLPIGILPDARILFPIADEESGGVIVVFARIPSGG